jgi:hypothetical protein
MAKCPICGKDIKNAKKTWKIAGRPDKKGKRTQLTMSVGALRKNFQASLREKKAKHCYTINFFYFQPT